MKNRRFVQRDIAKKIPNVKRYVRIPAFMGDGAGNFDVSGKPGYVYIRFTNGQLWTAYNAANAPKRDDTKIWVGTSEDFPLRLVVLGLGDVYEEPGWPSQEFDISSLIWPGANTLFIHPEQFTKFLVMPYSGFVQQVFGGAFTNLDGTAGRVANQLVNISSYQPSAGAVWIVLQYNSAGVVSVVEGTTVAAKSLLVVANIPAATNNPMVAIKLYNGQTQTQRDPNGINDYVDLRFGGVPTHTHDAGDLPYTPNALYDWDCALDPGDVGDGLDQLAARIVPLEATPPGTWDGDIADLDETSSADIGEAIADTDQGIIYNASGAAWVRFAWSRVKTYIQALTDTLYLALNGWIPVSATWTRTGDHTFTVSGDVTATYRKGAKVRYKDGGAFEYGVIASSSYSAPNTTVTLITNTDYAMAAATITDTYLSYIENPEGFPHWFNFSPVLSGSGGSAGTYAEDLTFGKFSVVGGSCTLQARKRITNLGSWSGDVKMTGPLDRVGTATIFGEAKIFANGGAVSSPKAALGIAGASPWTFYKTVFGAVQWSDLAVNDFVLVNMSYDI